MSKTQKILTLLAMIAFCVIIALHHKTINYWEPGFGMLPPKNDWSLQTSRGRS